MRSLRRGLSSTTCCGGLGTGQWLAEYAFGVRLESPLREPSATSRGEHRLRKGLIGDPFGADALLSMLRWAPSMEIQVVLPKRIWRATE
jgi:hypothetical protein